MVHLQSSQNSGENEEGPGPLASRIGPLLFMTGIFFLICLARAILSPLMPAIKEELGLGHDDAGSLFFLMTIGHSTMVLGSGFVSSLLNHRRTILLASFALGGALLTVALNPGLRGIQVGLVLAGLASGLYIPSGIATLTSLVRPGDWGKAIAIHEVAPNLSFVAGPLLSEALLHFVSWRGVLILLAIASFVSGLIFIRFGKGGSFPGEPPRVKTLRILLVEPSFWLMVILFSLGIGASSGLYNMMPLFLIAAKGDGPELGQHPDGVVENSNLIHFLCGRMGHRSVWPQNDLDRGFPVFGGDDDPDRGDIRRRPHSFCIPAGHCCRGLLSRRFCGPFADRVFPDQECDGLSDRPARVHYRSRSNPRLHRDYGRSRFFSISGLQLPE